MQYHTHLDFFGEGFHVHLFVAKDGQPSADVYPDELTARGNGHSAFVAAQEATAILVSILDDETADDFMAWVEKVIGVERQDLEVRHDALVVVTTRAEMLTMPVFPDRRTVSQR